MTNPPSSSPLRSSTAIALTIAGSDSGGGAGIQADLKTFSALGVYGASVITALTAQNTREVRAIHDVDAAFIASQLDAVCDDLAISAVKIGMLSRPEVIQTVAAAIRRRRLHPVVLDPVMVAKSGDALLRDEAVGALREELLPLATLITPNLPEAGVLLARAAPANENEMIAAARELQRLGSAAVLLKGGHLAGEQSPDVLLSGDHLQTLPAPRIATRNTHGTGCSLSSAIAALLARGLELRDAVRDAKHYMQDAIAAADRLQIGDGHGHGPVHHFHRWW